MTCRSERDKRLRTACSGFADGLGERMVGEQHRHCCRADSRSRRSSATTRRTMATPAIRCGRSSIRTSPARPSSATRISGSIPRRFFSRRPTADSMAISDEIHLTGPGLATWDFSAIKDTAHSRAADPAISRGDLQPAEPRELQHAESDRLYADGSLGHGGRDHQHVDDCAAGAVAALKTS